MCLTKLELTLAIIKPHVIKQPHALLNIRQKIFDNNFKIVRSTQKCLSLSQAEQFYEEHKENFFYNRLITFMTSGASEFYILCRENAIKEWRNLMGPTKVLRAQFSDPNSIRGTYGLSDTRNATHGSDSPESVTKEIRIFFDDFNIKSWYEKEEQHFRANKIKFDSDKFVHYI